MKSQSGKTIQRTLIITCGAVAGEVGQLLSHHLQEETAPKEAVSITPIECVASMEDGLTAGLLSISDTNLRRALAVRGWRPVQVDEVLVYLVADIDTAEVDLSQTAALTRKLAQQLLGVDVSILLLALFPGSSEEQRSLSWPGLLQQKNSFDRGVAVLGPANEIGLRLADQEALAQLCAQLLRALTLTPLRDAPEWLASLNGATGAYMSLGLSTWDWSPTLVQEYLAWEWVQQVISRWLAEPAQASDPLAGAFHWFSEHQLDPETLLHRLPGWQEIGHPVPNWGSPQPWHVRKQAQACQPTPAGFSILSTIGSQIQQEMDTAIKAAIRTILDDHPISSVANAINWLQAFSYQLEDFHDVVAGRETLAADLLAGASSAYVALQADLESKLQQWPQPTLRSWIRVFLSPWQWPELVLQYRRLQDLGKRLVRQGLELQRLRFEQEALKTTDKLYCQSEKSWQRISLQVEEIGEMLRFLSAEIEKKAINTGEIMELIESLWQSQVEMKLHLQQEAADAAALIGGLGRQLDQLDDALLGFLLDEGRRRMADIGKMTAVSALLRLYDNPEAQQKWWLETTEKASPMWPYDPAQLSDMARSYDCALTVICTPQAAKLQEPLNLHAASDHLWIADADPTRIWILRLRGGIPAGEFLHGSSQY